MNESNPSNRNGNPLVILAYCIPPVILLLVAAFLWLRHADKTDELNRLAAQNTQLQQELAVAKAEIDNLNSGDSSKQTKERLALAHHERAPAPAEAEVETLLLKEPSVVRTGSDLTARFGFEPAEDTPLPETVTLVVRVPNRAESIIRSLKPVSQSSYSAVEVVVNSKGTLGMIEGSPADLKALEFELTVSGPTTATVRGSDGIIDFEMDIAPDGCATRKL